MELGSVNEDSFQWPQVLSQGINVVPVHSHNDYLRRVPLFDASAACCTGVEADVSLKCGNLLVGHTETTLNVNNTLRSLYLEPLLRILEQQNLGTPSETKPSGVITSSPSSTLLVLLIDMKTDGSSTWPVVLQQLEPLLQKGWLTIYTGTKLIIGPIIVVGTGTTPFPPVLEPQAVNSTNDVTYNTTTNRFIFFDTPLDNLSSVYNASNSYYASAPLGGAVGRTWFGQLGKRQLQTVSEQTHLAASNGLELVCSFGRDVLLRGHCDTLFGLDGFFLSFYSAFCCLVLYVVFCSGTIGSLGHCCSAYDYLSVFILISTSKSCSSWFSHSLEVFDHY